MSLVGKTVTVFEVVNVSDRVCDLGCRHPRVSEVVRFDLRIVESRDVRQVWAEGWAQKPLPTALGYRAVDEVGRSWLMDWDGQHNDGPSRQWRSGDRRADTAIRGVDGQPAPAHSTGGWIETPRADPMAAFDPQI